jgi:hypothetical protein
MLFAPTGGEKGRGMRIVKWAWRLATNLAAVAVALAMFSKASSPFETIVVSGLTLIYLKVVSATSSLLRVQMQLALVRGRQFITLARLLNDPEAGSYVESADEDSKEWEATTAPYYLNTVFSALLYLVAIWNLVKVTLL